MLRLLFLVISVFVDVAVLQNHLSNRTTFVDFFDQATLLNPNAIKITRTICGDRIENLQDDLVPNVRYLDKLVDELAKGRPIDNILR